MCNPQDVPWTIANPCARCGHETDGEDAFCLTCRRQAPAQPPHPLDVLRQAIYEAEQLADPDAALDRLAGAYNEAAGLVNLLGEVQAEAKRIVADILTELQRDEAKTASGNIARVQATPTVTYDRKGLDELCAVDERVGQLLSPYRRVTPREPYIRIEPVRQAPRRAG